MPNTIATINVMTLTDIRNQPISSDTILLLVGKTSVGDGLGGFYRWDAASTLDEDLTYLNVVKSNLSTTGRWVRIFQRVRSYPNGVLVMTGGVKTFYVLGQKTDSNGQVTAYLTDTGTAAGNALFTSVWTCQGQAQGSFSDTNDMSIGGQKSLSADLKTLVYQFGRGNNTVLSLLGVNVLGIRAAALNTPVTLIVTGL